MVERGEKTLIEFFLFHFRARVVDREIRWKMQLMNELKVDELFSRLFLGNFIKY